MQDNDKKAFDIFYAWLADEGKELLNTTMLKLINEKLDDKFNAFMDVYKTYLEEAIEENSIINIYKRNLTNYITNQNMQEYFLDLFQDYDKEVNPLNWVVYRPEQYQLPAKDLIDLPRKGLLSLINFLIS